MSKHEVPFAYPTMCDIQNKGIKNNYICINIIFYPNIYIKTLTGLYQEQSCNLSSYSRTDQMTFYIVQVGSSEKQTVYYRPVSLN